MERHVGLKILRTTSLAVSLDEETPCQRRRPRPLAPRRSPARRSDRRRRAVFSAMGGRAVVVAGAGFGASESSRE